MMLMMMLLLLMVVVVVSVSLEIDLELVAVAYVERVQAAVGILELLGSVDGHGARLDVDVVELKAGRRLADELLQLALERAHRLLDADALHHLLLAELDLHRDLLANVEVDVGELVELAVLALELVVALGPSGLGVLHVVAYVLAFAVLALVAAYLAAVENGDRLVEVGDEQVALQLLVAAGVLAQQRYVLDAHVLELGKLAQLVECRPLAYVQSVDGQDLEMGEAGRVGRVERWPELVMSGRIGIGDGREIGQLVVAYDEVLEARERATQLAHVRPLVQRVLVEVERAHARHAQLVGEVDRVVGVRGQVQLLELGQAREQRFDDRQLDVAAVEDERVQCVRVRHVRVEVAHGVARQRIEAQIQEAQFSERVQELCHLCCCCCFLVS